MFCSRCGSAFENQRCYEQQLCLCRACYANAFTETIWSMRQATVLYDGVDQDSRAESVSAEQGSVFSLSEEHWDNSSAARSFSLEDDDYEDDAGDHQLEHVRDGADDHEAYVQLQRGWLPPILEDCFE